MTIEHAAIWTTDLEKMRRYYVEYFGADSGGKYENSTKGFSSFFLTFDSGCRLEIMQMDTVTERPGQKGRQYLGFAHLAFSVGSDDEVVRLTERLRADGHEVVSEPRHTGDGYFESCVLDPDGNRVEITC